MTNLKCGHRGTWILGLVLTLTAVPVWAGHAWGNYHWERSSNPVTIELGDNVDSRWDVWLTEASDDWRKSNVLDTPIGPGKSKGNCKATDGRVEVCNKAYGFTGWLGLAQIWASGDHIVKGVAKLNDSYHDLAPYNQDGWRDMVMCQEVGHTFGLGHQDVNFDNGNLETCMDYTSNPDGPPENRQPNSHDYNELEVIYQHLDSDGGNGGNDPKPCRGKRCRNSAPPAFDMPLHAQDQWGQLISVSTDGGQAVYVQDFGGDFRVYTHVTWTLEKAEEMDREHNH